ncbi:saccharopine dehydrogenase family protein [Chryseobacterium sp. JUb7]|uniref:saccharopine dehydrogenase family protein n=1 Tax=Chryseobacterium sp. JUb7 TaxID=2940599 RepID=UPI00216970DF|nr:saccharopine dehydrogenase NADP-binding domain-containing protein [Chryseobacterium sp. JUb7]MCS3528690.1 saccharopine dehydrogenase-like NADP-dependent oxidoreductase [Chryseobacterium sp. JUb7]
MSSKILIVGGYGAVGSIIAENIAEIYPEKVIVAGRSFYKAKKLAEKLHGKVIPIQFDVNNSEDFSILNEVKLIIMCLDQNNTEFVEYCIAKSIAYVDISAQYQTLKNIETLHYQAVHGHANVILSVGLAPGITNLLAQYAVSQLEDTDSIDIFILLGLGEKHGDFAYRWTFNNLDSRYRLTIDNKIKVMKSFTQPVNTNLLGKRNFYLFDFSDQYFLANTLNVPKIQTRMAFDVEWFTELTAILRKLRITKLFKNETVQNLVIRSFHHFPLGTDVYGVKVVAKDKDGNTTDFTVSGNNEGKITACVATEIALLVLNENLPKGVLHSHQIVKNIPLFLDNLKKYDSSFQYNI